MPSPISPSPTSTMTMEWPPKPSSSRWQPPASLPASLNVNRDTSNPSTPTSPLATQPAFTTDMDAELQELRRSVVTNLTLRPLPSSSQSTSPPATRPSRTFTPLKTGSTGSSIGLTDSSGGTTSTGTISPASPSSTSDHYSPTDILAEYADPIPKEPQSKPNTPSQTHPPPTPSSFPIDVESLARSMASAKRPLVLDTRSPNAFSLEHIKGSINLTVPTLMLKRYKRTGAPNMRWLREYISSDTDRGVWDRLLGQGTGEWDSSIVVLDEEMDEREKSSGASWLLLNVLSAPQVKWLQGGLAAFRAAHPESIITGETTPVTANIITTDLDLTYSPVSDSPSSGLSGSFAAGGRASESAAKADSHPPGPSALLTKVPSAAPGINSSSQEGGVGSDSHARQRVSPNPGIGGAAQPSRSRPLPRTLIHTRSMVSLPSSSSSYSGSPPSSYDPNSNSTSIPPVPNTSASNTTPAMSFPTPRGRSNTALLNKKSKDRLSLMKPLNTNLAQNPNSQFPPPPEMPPKLSLLTRPIKSATLGPPIASPKVSGAGFGLRLNIPPSPSKISFGQNVTPLGAAGFGLHDRIKSPQSGTSVFFTPVETPSQYANTYPETPAESSFHSGQYDVVDAATPLTARPPPSPSAMTSESESAMPPFVISTILPGFLYLGPELSNEEQADELEALGVKRILNMAIECEPEDYGLDLEKRFDKYNKIPMRDTVEEDRIGRGLIQVCELLDDARLHDQPTYVHCKAGKSRSVTAVMAYLIHANHWPLSRAYAFVNERRKGVSPNIGFVSELMNFEEAKLGTKSVGVVPEATTTRLRPAHARDSLPPNSLSVIGVPIVAGGMGGEALGAGAGEEFEKRDGEGRYRHLRRAPVSEQTLQPGRRMSKAGLESSWAETA